MNTLRESASDYIAMRRALGCKLHAAGYYLLDFVAFLEQNNACVITSKMALRWAQQPTDVKPVTWANRLAVVRGFARYHHVTDPRTEIPASNLLPHRPMRMRPYIYTDLEIQKILKAALNLPRGSSFKRQTYHCLFGLLCVSGMRLSEVLNLKVANVDFDAGVLTVEKSKFGKSRLIPLHESTQKVLSAYKAHRDTALKGRVSDYFFLSEAGIQLNSHTTRYIFYSLLKQIGSPRQKKKCGPRLHDLRHRFAIETMLNWYRRGQDVERCLPVLSTYLGHLNVTHTYWYLTACPELMGLAVQRLESHWEAKS
jgi:integrase/recombinase XerD